MKTIAVSAGSVVAGRFVIEAEAGSGGMGSVFLARDSHSTETSHVALKLLQGTSSQREDIERFTREAQILSELTHPAIVSYIAHGQTPEGVPFLAMELLRGEDLAQRLRRGKLSVSESMILLRGVAGALAAAHQRGIIHRDLKPSNLYLRDGDIERVTLLDFGIARRTRAGHSMTGSGVVVGTLDYMAPEQARAQRDVSSSADIFSLGCVLFECLTGQPPFVGEQIAAVLAKILFEEAPALRELVPEIPPALEALVARMLRKDPHKRPKDAAALLVEIDALGDFTSPSEAPRTGTISLRSLADSEQILVSVVVATPPNSVAGTGATVRAADVEEEKALHQTLRDHLEQLGARSELLADGSLVVTLTQKGSAMDQATLAARCALALQEHWPEAWVALATGRGVLHERLPVGEAIDRAVRAVRSLSAFQSLKDPWKRPAGEGIWVDEVSAALLDARFTLSRGERGTLLSGERIDADESRPLLGKPTPCLGREKELGSLEGELNSCIEEPEARAVLVTAPPGTGKSRLRHEFVRRLEARETNIEMVLGRGDLINLGSPYALLSDALRRLCQIKGGEPASEQRAKLLARLGRHVAPAEAPRLAEFLGELCGVCLPDESSVRLQAARNDPKIMNDQVSLAFLDWLRAECADHPMLLILEDVQWGDPLTASLVDTALRELSDQPFMALLLARPEVGKLFPGLAASRRVQEMRLGPLTKKASERLVHHSLGNKVGPDTLTRIVEQAAGNALYLEELIRATAVGKGDALPETVLAMLQSRISRLDPSARRILRGASVFGITFWSGGVRELYGGVDSSDEVATRLSALIDAEIIEQHRESRFPGEKEYAFRHSLMRDAAYGMLMEQDRQIAHQLAAAYLEGVGESDAIVLADHLRQGGDAMRAAPYYVQAAEQSYHRFDSVGTLNRAAQAEACGAQGEQLGLVQILKLMGHYWRHEWSDALPLGLSGLKLLPVGHLWWCEAMPVVFSIAGNLNQHETLQDLVQLFAQAAPLPGARRSYLAAESFLVITFSMLGSREQARLFLDRIDRERAQIDEHDALARGFIHRGHGWFSRLLQPEPWLAAIHGQACVDAFREAEDWRNLSLVAHPLHGMAQAELGDIAAGERSVREALALALRLDEAYLITNAKAYLAHLLSEYGDEAQRDEAHDLASQMVQQNVSPAYTGYAHASLGRVLYRKGALDDAEMNSRKGIELLKMRPTIQLIAYRSLIRVLLAQGRADDARAVGGDSLRILVDLGGAGYIEPPLRLAVAEALHATGYLPAAQRAIAEAARELHLRAEKIPDSDHRQRYLTKIRDHVRIQELAHAWLEGSPG